jgi:hypothetical protein
VNPLEVYDRYQREWSDVGLHLPWLKDNAHGRVLEIGVREGISTAALLLGVRNRGGHVWSVDIDDRSALYDAKDWSFIKANSNVDYSRIFNEMGHRDASFKIDLLFIDGDHSYAACMSDLTMYGPYADVIAVHDTNSNYLGVWEATIAYLRQNLSKFKRAEFRNESHGLGILYR